MNRWLITLALAGACVACSPSVSEDAFAHARQAVTGGAPTHLFPAIVALVDEQGQTFCSGVVVSPTEVLSAAHCMLPPAPKLAWLTSDTVAPAAQQFEAASVRIHPDYDLETHAHDLARIVTTSPMGLEQALLPMAALAAEDAGIWVQVVGFGLEGLQGAGNRKTAGLSLLESVDEDSLLLAPAPATPCKGDSGGGVFSGEEPEGHLLGVISRGDPLCGSYAIATPLDIETLEELRAAPEPLSCMASASRPAHPFFSAACLAMLYARRRRWLGIESYVPRRYQSLRLPVMRDVHVADPGEWHR